MKFAAPRRKQTPESVVPMINVVFLLLIFFMMSATITAAPPFDLTLPQTDGQGEVTGELTLYLSADGSAEFDGLLGDAAWGALAAEETGAPLTIRADAGLATTVLAQTLARLAQIGQADVELVIRNP
jgi:biopolymer transport protein ExbD